MGYYFHKDIQLFLSNLYTNKNEWNEEENRLANKERKKMKKQIKYLLAKICNYISVLKFLQNGQFLKCSLFS